MLIDYLFVVAAVLIVVAQGVLLMRHARVDWGMWWRITLGGAVLMAALIVVYAHWVGPVLHPAPLESEAPR